MTIDEFRKVDLRVAKVVAAERMPGSEKLLRLSVDVGEAGNAGGTSTRQLIAGIGKAYTPEELIGKNIVVVANLEPRTFTLRTDAGETYLQSQGMLLAAHGEEGAPVLVSVLGTVPAGAPIS